MKMILKGLASFLQKCFPLGWNLFRAWKDLASVFPAFYDFRICIPQSTLLLVLNIHIFNLNHDKTVSSGYSDFFRKTTERMQIVHFSAVFKPQSMNPMSASQVDGRRFDTLRLNPFLQTLETCKRVIAFVFLALCVFSILFQQDISSVFVIFQLPNKKRFSSIKVCLCFSALLLFGKNHQFRVCSGCPVWFFSQFIFSTNA